MKKIGMSFACLLIAACGGSKSEPREPVQPTASAIETAPEAETGTYEEPVAGDPVAEWEEETAEEPLPEPGEATLAGGGTQPTPGAAEEPMAADPAAAGDMMATAELTSVKDGSAMGTVTFEKVADGIQITAELSGLKKNKAHAFYVHENGDCSNKAKKVGGHLDPTDAKHGPPSSSQRHAGDFGNITADEQGNATFSMTTDSITMEGDRPDSVLNRAVVLYSGKDNKRGKPGAPLACGVIQPATR